MSAHASGQAGAGLVLSSCSPGFRAMQGVIPTHWQSDTGMKLLKERLGIAPFMASAELAIALGSWRSCRFPLSKWSASPMHHLLHRPKGVPSPPVEL